jgi:hypothetical protein
VYDTRSRANFDGHDDIDARSNIDRRTEGDIPYPEHLLLLASSENYLLAVEVVEEEGLLCPEGEAAEEAVEEASLLGTRRSVQHSIRTKRRMPDPCKVATRVPEQQLSRQVGVVCSIVRIEGGQ